MDGLQTLTFMSQVLPLHKPTLHTSLVTRFYVPHAAVGPSIQPFCMETEAEKNGWLGEKKNKNKKKAKNYAGWWLWIEIERASEKGAKQSTPGNTSSTEMCPEMLCSDVWVEADPRPLQIQVLLLTEQLLNRLWVNRTTQPLWFSMRLLLLNYH